MSASASLRTTTALSLLPYPDVSAYSMIGISILWAEVGPTATLFSFAPSNTDTRDCL